MGVSIGYSNLIDFATLSGGLWSSNAPLANLKTRYIGQTAKSQNDATSSTKFDMDFGGEVGAGVFALINHSIQLDGLIRLRASNDPTFATSLYDSTWLPAWEAMYDTEDLDWEAPNYWTGQPILADLYNYWWNWYLNFDYNVYARYWRLEIDDTTNTNSFVTLGRPFLGKSWQPRHNMEFAPEIGHRQNTTVETAISGAESYSQRRASRYSRFSTGWMDESDAFSFAFEIENLMGRDREVLFQHDVNDTTQRFRRSFLGTLEQSNPITHPQLGVYRKSWDIKESI